MTIAKHLEKQRVYLTIVDRGGVSASVRIIRVYLRKKGGYAIHLKSGCLAAHPCDFPDNQYDFYATLDMTAVRKRRAWAKRKKRFARAERIK